MVCGSSRSKSRLAKAAGAEPSGQMREEKLHAVVARSTFRSQNVQNTPFSDHFWKLRCRKSARRCGAKHISKCKSVKNWQSQTISDHFWKLRWWKSGRRCGAKQISKSKCTKHTMLGPLLEVDMSKKCTPLWRKAHFEVKSAKISKVGVRNTFGRSDVVLRGRRKGFCMFAWHVQHFVWLGITFSWQAQYFRHMDWKNHKTHWDEAVSSELNVRFLKEVSQNFFVFDVVNFEKWGNLAELLRSCSC